MSQSYGSTGLAQVKEKQYLFMAVAQPAAASAAGRALQLRCQLAHELLPPACAVLVSVASAPRG